MIFNLLVIGVTVALGCLLIAGSPLLRAIVLDTIKHPSRAAVFEVADSGVITVTPAEAHVNDATQIVEEKEFRFPIRTSHRLTAVSTVAVIVAMRAVR